MTCLNRLDLFKKYHWGKFLLFQVNNWDFVVSGDNAVTASYFNIQFTAQITRNLDYCNTHMSYLAYLLLVVHNERI